MRKCFRDLGLRENATKDQVQEAYERKVRRYKGADYAEEPEYVHRKLAELHASYEEAYDLAKPGTGQYVQSPSAKRAAKALTSYRDDEQEGKKREKREKRKERNRRTEPVKKKTNNKLQLTSGMIKFIVAIAILIIAAIGASEDSDVSYDDMAQNAEYKYEYAYDYIYNYGDLTADENTLCDKAWESYYLLTEYDQRGMATIKEEKASAYMEQSNAFAKNYWGKASIEQVTAYLCETYENYPVTDNEPLVEQLDNILAFYGFMPMEDAVWYDNPYTESKMEGYGDYLDYLNQFHETHN